MVMEFAVGRASQKVLQLPLMYLRKREVSGMFTVILVWREIIC